jgi:uncharacterized membrane protein YqgA involved in biofilm formation
MSHVGTLINALAIVIGSLIGLVLNARLPQQFAQIGLYIIGGFIIGISTYWFMDDLMKYPSFETMLITSIQVGSALLIGGFFGYFLRLDHHLTQFILSLEQQLKLPPIGQAFLHASLLFVIGTLAILGPLTEALTGTIDLLLFKSLLDGIASIFLATTFGYGVIFSSLSVIIYQSLFHLLGLWIASYTATGWLPSFTLVGHIILIALGLSMIKIKTSKPVNLLPSLLVMIVIYFLF